MNASNKKILPADVFVSVFGGEPTDAELWKGVTINDSGNRNSGNEFIDRFASLIRKYQKKALLFYAKKMDVKPIELLMTVKVSSGITARDWLNDYLNLEARDLLENSGKSIKEIARFLNFSQSAFCQFFVRINKCSPYEWRMLKKYGKKISYHY